MASKIKPPFSPDSSTSTSSGDGFGIFDTIPVLSPPPHTLPNFTHPHRNASALLIFGAILLSISTLFLSNRLISKLLFPNSTHRSRLSWSDLTLSLGFLGSVAFYTSCVVGSVDGSLGRHLWETTIGDAREKELLVPAYLVVVIPPPTLMLLKTTFFLMYLDIFSPFKWLKIAAWMGGGVNVVFGVVATVFMFVEATPRGDGWLGHTFSEGYGRVVAFAIPQASIGLAIDVVVLVLPILGVGRLKMERKRKWGVGLIFGTAGLAVLASAMNVFYRNRLNRSLDFLWNITAVLIVTLAELLIGVIVACMPAASRTYRQLLPHYRQLRFRISKSRYFSTLGSSKGKKSTKELEGSSTRVSEQDVACTCGMAHARGCHTHMDMCQSFAGLDVDVPSGSILQTCLRGSERLQRLDIEKDAVFWAQKKQPVIREELVRGDSGSTVVEGR